MLRHLLIVALVSSTAAYGRSAVRSLSVRRHTREVVAVAEAPDKEDVATDEAALANTIFTLQSRDDGWDDVRQKIVGFKNERAPALDELKSKAKQSADEIAKSGVVRWSKVLGQELIELTENAMGTSLELPKPSSIQLKELPKPSLKSLPKPSLTDLPKASLPSMPKPSLPSLPKPSLPDLPKPSLSLPKKAAPAPPPPPPPAPTGSAVKGVVNLLLLAGTAAFPLILLLAAFDADLFTQLQALLPSVSTDALAGSADVVGSAASTVGEVAPAVVPEAAPVVAPAVVPN